MVILENNTKPFMTVHVGSKKPPVSVTFIQMPKELITPTALKSYSMGLRSDSTYSDVVIGHAKQVVTFYYLLKLQLILTDVFLKGIVIHMLFWSLLVSKIEKSNTR